MINLKDHKTGYLYDPWGHLGQKRRKMLDQSWAGLFREQILNELPVQELIKHYDTARGRPTKELGADDDGLVEPALKPLTEIAADSLQNPSDPDAGYDRHQGQGYQARVMEAA